MTRTAVDLVMFTLQMHPRDIEDFRYRMGVSDTDFIEGAISLIVRNYFIKVDLFRQLCCWHNENLLELLIRMLTP